MSRRVRRIAFAATVVATMGLVAPAFAASSGSVTTTLGQTMTAAITSPNDQQHFTVGNNVTVNGTVTLTGATTVVPTNVAYVIDTSGSTIEDCRPSVPTDTRDVLDCEKEGAIALNNSLETTPSLNAGVIQFNTTASTEQGFVPPTNPAIDTAINGLTSGGGTNYDDALTQLNSLFVGVPATNRKVAFFLSDGFPDPPMTTGPGSPLALVAAAGIHVNTYSVGEFAPTCSDTTSSLRVIADTTGGQCTDVLDPSTLAANLTNARVDVKINGHTAIPATVNGNNWTVTFNSTGNNQVVLGNNPIVATATAPDGTKLDVNITIIGDPLPTTTTTSTTVQVVQVTPRFTG